MSEEPAKMFRTVSRLEPIPEEDDQMEAMVMELTEDLTETQVDLMVAEFAAMDIDT